MSAAFRSCGVAFFLLDLDGGGAERAIVALAGEIAKQKLVVEFVVGDADRDYRYEISPAVNVVDFSTRSRLLLLWRLIVYLRVRKPAVVMSALDTANILLLVAAQLSGYKGRVIVSQRAVVAASQNELRTSRRFVLRFFQCLFFRQATALISNSRAAAGDVRTLLGVSSDRLFTIHNAVDMDRINRLAKEPINDHFVHKRREPFIVSVGSFTKRKDVATVVRAFKIVKARRKASLILVGKGPEQQEIERLVSDLGLSDDVHLPGFDINPYKWISAATVFVSSSTGEGFPNVIAEALALDRLIVATDCPGDTAELLEYGKWGRLVPVGDPERMADAILAALDDPNPPVGRVRAADFAPSKITSAYLNVLLPNTSHAAHAYGQSV